MTLWVPKEQKIHPQEQLISTVDKFPSHTPEETHTDLGISKLSATLYLFHKKFSYPIFKQRLIFKIKPKWLVMLPHSRSPTPTSQYRWPAILIYQIINNGTAQNLLHNRRSKSHRRTDFKVVPSLFSTNHDLGLCMSFLSSTNR